MSNQLPQLDSKKLTEAHERLIKSANNDVFQDIKVRKARLKKLRSVLWEERDAIVEAIYQDFGKPKVETELTEVYVLRSKIKHTIRHLSHWTDYKKVPAPTSLLGISGYV